MEKLELDAYQLYSALNSCEARIDNGADITEAFGWLQEEIQEIAKGVEVYEPN